MDFENIARDAFGRRIDLAQPERSLLLLKPTLQLPHRGGKRLELDSHEYRMLRDWIAAGARFDATSDSAILGIKITPAEVVLTAGAGHADLRVTATYADGSSADVTALARFETLDDEVAAVDRDGRVAARNPGDTAILVRYAGQVAPTQVLVPRPIAPPRNDSRDAASFITPSPLGGEAESAKSRLVGSRGEGSDTGDAATLSSAGFIDDQINATLAKLNVVASELCTDVEFLRRMGLDLIGTLPTPGELRAFVADTRPDKRARKIGELMERPEYAAFWATKFSDWTGNDTRYLANPYRPKQSKQWHDWFRDKLTRNVPYSEIATGVITATSCEGMASEKWQEWAKAEDARLKGKEWNFEYAKRRTLDLPYVKARNLDPDNLALQMSYCFLGVKIECAQCHKHPMDRWTQADFGSFASTFAYVGVSKEFARKPLPLEESTNNGMTGINEVFHLDAPRKVYTDPRTGQALRPRALGGLELPAGQDQDPRVALAAWMTAPDNPFFAKAMVNRLWAHYFGRGLVEPSDALAAANPPSHPALFDELARRFAAGGYDLKSLHRAIMSSHAYQRSWRPNETNASDRRNLSHALVRRLGAEQIVDSIVHATGVPLQFAEADAPPGTRAIEVAPSRLTGSAAYALAIFGRPQRQQNCDCERSSQPGLPQTLYLFNDAELLDKIRKPGARLERLLAEHADNARLVEELYLWTLCRWPSDSERQDALSYLAADAARRERAEDLFWALVNHREFLVNR
jgi:hypothetical protein